MAEDDRGDTSADPRSGLLPESTTNPATPTAPEPDGPATESIRIDRTTTSPPLRFGPDDTGPLPHWTEPPTGEVPRIFADEGARRRRRLGGAAVAGPGAGATTAPPPRHRRRTTSTSSLGDGHAASAPSTSGRARATPSSTSRTTSPSRCRRPASPIRPASRPIRTRRRPGRLPRPAVAAGRAPPPTSGFTPDGAPPGATCRWPSASASPSLALFLILAGRRQVPHGAGRAGPGCAAVEFYDKLREKGYQPATLVGLVAVVACRWPPTGRAMAASRSCVPGAW